MCIDEAETDMYWRSMVHVPGSHGRRPPSSWEDDHNINRAVRPQISQLTRDEFGSIVSANIANCPESFSPRHRNAHEVCLTVDLPVQSRMDSARHRVNRFVDRITGETRCIVRW